MYMKPYSLTWKYAYTIYSYFHHVLLSIDICIYTLYMYYIVHYPYVFFTKIWKENACECMIALRMDENIGFMQNFCVELFLDWIYSIKLLIYKIKWHLSHHVVRHIINKWIKTFNIDSERRWFKQIHYRCLFCTKIYSLLLIKMWVHCMGSTWTWNCRCRSKS